MKYLVLLLAAFNLNAGEIILGYQGAATPRVLNFHAEFQFALSQLGHTTTVVSYACSPSRRNWPNLQLVVLISPEATEPTKLLAKQTVKMCVDRGYDYVGLLAVRQDHSANLFPCVAVKTNEVILFVK